MALMPQLWMFTKGGGQVDGMTSHFVVMHTLGPQFESLTLSTWCIVLRFSSGARF